MLHPLYTNTFVQNITSDVVAKTGLDWSEIELLLATQTSNCIKFEMDGQNVMVKQVTALLPDQSNKDCFEASFEYEFCGQTMTYKVKLNIQLDEFCDTPTITNVTFEDPNFTISGSITSDVFVEFSEDDGVNWERVLNAFPAGATIVTDDLPTGVDFKIRLVALCDETKISNVFDFGSTISGNLIILNGSLLGGNVNITSVSINGTEILTSPITPQNILETTYSVSADGEDDITVIFGGAQDSPVTLFLGDPLSFEQCISGGGQVGFTGLDLTGNPNISITLGEEGGIC